LKYGLSGLMTRYLDNVNLSANPKSAIHIRVCKVGAANLNRVTHAQAGFNG
jgi:hypothetical protein